MAHITINNTRIGGIATGKTIQQVIAEMQQLKFMEKKPENLAVILNGEKTNNLNYVLKKEDKVQINTK